MVNCFERDVVDWCRKVEWHELEVFGHFVSTVRMERESERERERKREGEREKEGEGGEEGGEEGGGGAGGRGSPMLILFSLLYLIQDRSSWDSDAHIQNRSSLFS